MSQLFIIAGPPGIGKSTGGLVDIHYDSIDLSFELNPKENRIFISPKLPNWVLKNFPKILQLKK